jgi:hypothetical protein
MGKKSVSFYFVKSMLRMQANAEIATRFLHRRYLLSMRVLYCVVFLLFVISAPAQSRAVSFSRIDWAVKFVDAGTPEALAQQLTAPYNTDLEKVRSIFRWITEHIAYTTRPRGLIRARGALYKPEPMDSLLALKPVDEIVAYNVLQKRSAVCNGYARLFKTLCSYAAIQAEIVNGYARVGLDRAGNRFRSNHSWNAVYVDSTWRLLDATWASGYISFSDEFVKHYDDFFFFPDPEQFIRSHYPEDLKWSLLQHPPTLREFYHTPFKLTAFAKYGIGTYAPESGVVEAAVGDTLQFQFELKGLNEFKMAPELNADAMIGSGVSSWHFLQPVVSGTQVVYRYPVQQQGVEWLHLVFNDDVVLRYKLNIRKPGL